jgi:hypothetical protein
MKKRSTYISPKSVKYAQTATITTSRGLIEKLAEDLVEMHNQDVFNLEYWPAARELVARFHVGEEKAKQRRGK